MGLRIEQMTGGACMTARGMDGSAPSNCRSLDVCFKLKDGDIWWRRHATTNTIKPQYCATVAWGSSNEVPHYVPTFRPSRRRRLARSTFEGNMVNCELKRGWTFCACPRPCPTKHWEARSGGAGDMRSGDQTDRCQII